MGNGLAILSVLQPEPPYSTVAALGTTYSADLVACMVALSHLDASASDDLKYNKIEALRALDRLRGRVLIAAQQGRVSVPSKSLAGLSLLDRIVLPVRFNESDHSFHPKVWVVRQGASGRPDRFILLVGSRNLTLSTAWDYGVALIGTRSQPNSGRSKRLDAVGEFVKHVCKLVDVPSFAEHLNGVEEVFWQMPEGVDDMFFEFLPGKNKSTNEFRLSSIIKGNPERVLAISPFLDTTAILAAAEAWSGARERLLISCTNDLDKVATRCPDELMFLKPFYVAGVAEAALRNSDKGAPLEEQKDRGLHAKVTVVEIKEKAGLVVGSPNLTSRAWSGRNCEAWIELLTSTKQIEPLWTWAKTRALAYTIPDIVPPNNKVTEALKLLRNTISAKTYTLREPPTEQNRLECDDILNLSTPLGSAILTVARYSTTTLCTKWNARTNSVELPACTPADRTSFITFNVGLQGEEISWVQTVKIFPPLNEQRDREAIARALGPRGFLQYLRSLLDESSSQSLDDHNNDKEHNLFDSRATRHLSHKLFQLEDILRRIAQGDSPALKTGSLREISSAIGRYRNILAEVEMTETEREIIEHFWSMWDAIEQGMCMP